MPDKHALFSPSAAHRWLTCPASLRLEATLPETDQTSSYAAEGTLAHTVAEATVKYWLNEINEQGYENQMLDFSKREYFSDEMVDCATAYAGYILGSLSDIPESTVALEQLVHMDRYAKDCWGTSDCIVIGEGALEVIDYKYGKGVEVEAEDNPQMKLYALGAIDMFSDVYRVDKVKMTIFQPRISSSPKSSEMTVEDLISWGTQIVKPAAKRALDKNSPCVPSEEACRFCKFRGLCHARAVQNLKDFNKDIIDTASSDPSLTRKELTNILECASEIRQWLSDVEAQAFDLLSHGEVVPGWKLVHGKSNRKLGDETEVVKALTSAGIAEPMLYKRSLITLSQMEKDFGKKFIADVLKDLITKPEGAPTLVPESDKRPAIAVLDDFDN